MVQPFALKSLKNEFYGYPLFKFYLFLDREEFPNGNKFPLFTDVAEDEDLEIRPRVPVDIGKNKGKGIPLKEGGK